MRGNPIRRFKKIDRRRQRYPSGRSDETGSVAQQFFYRMYREWMMNWLFLGLFGVKLRNILDSDNSISFEDLKPQLNDNQCYSFHDNNALTLKLVDRRKLY